MRVRRSWGCGRVGAAAAPASSPASFYKQKTKVYKGSSAMPQSTRKKLRGAAYYASPEQRLRSAGKILVRAKFCQRNPIFQRGRNYSILPHIMN
jgi:hypothetical protein